MHPFTFFYINLHLFPVLLDPSTTLRVNGESIFLSFFVMNFTKTNLLTIKLMLFFNSLRFYVVSTSGTFENFLANDPRESNLNEKTIARSVLLIPKSRYFFSS